jgi:hypothetical protein
MKKKNNLKNTGTSNIYSILVLVILIGGLLLYINKIQVGNQKALTLDSGLDQGIIDGGNQTKKCPNPALTLVPDNTSSNPTTILRGQQQYQLLVVNAITGHCAVKINSLAVGQLGNAGSSAVERLEFYADYGTGSNRYVAPLSGSQFSYNTTTYNTTIPAYAGQANSGVPPVKLRFLVSMSPDIPINQQKTIQLQILNGLSVSATDMNGNAVVVGGNFPINSILFQVPIIAQASGGITNTATGNVTQTSAKLKSVVSGSTYGVTNSYTGFVINPSSNNILLNPTSIVPITGIPLNIGPTNVSHIVNGLTPATTYQYRSCVRYGITPNTNMWNDNQVCGPVKTVTTL